MNVLSVLKRRQPARELLVGCYDFLISARQCLRIAPYRLSAAVSANPFLIVGSGRSGTTLLRRALCESDRVHIPPETYVLNDVIRTFQRNSAMRWSDLVVLLLAKFEYHPEFVAFQCTLRDLANELMNLAPQDRALATVIDQIYLFHARRSGKPDAVVWGDKTPLNTFHLGRIRRVFPDARFIHLLRDGVDVVHSYVSSGLYHSHIDAAERWLDSVNAAQRFASRFPGQSLTVRYEDLVIDPDNTLEAIRKFLGIEDIGTGRIPVNDVSQLGDVAIRPHHSRVYDAIDLKSVGKGRQELSASQLKRISPLIGRTLKRYGYRSV